MAKSVKYWKKANEIEDKLIKRIDKRK